MKTIGFKFITVLISAVAVSSLGAAVSLNFSSDIPAGISWPQMHAPMWSNGTAINVQNSHTITPLIWLVEHQSARTVPFSIPGAQLLNVLGCDRGLDGTIGLSGTTVSVDGQHSGFVAWISADAAKSNVIRTGSFRPEVVAVAPDGTIWVAGIQPVKPGSTLLLPQAGAIRHFNQAGQMLNSFLPQSTIGSPIAFHLQGQFLRASRTAIGWYSPGEGRYVELSLLGKLLVDISVKSLHDNSRVDGFALSDRGEVFVGASWFTPLATDNKKGAEFRAIFVLDKAGQTWRPLLQRSWFTGTRPDSAGDDFDKLSGVEGDKLVVRSIRRRLRFYDIGE